MVPQIVTTRRVVPNVQPIAESTPYRIAIIGEAPGEDEENHQYPFVGKSGQLLTNLLHDVGIDRHRCLIANVCQVRPPRTARGNNDIAAFAWEGPEIQNGIHQLNEDIQKFNPNICVLLGATPLRVARGKGAKITAWRGSLFRATENSGPFAGRKCIAGIHPAAVLREFSWFPLLKFDLKRARGEGDSPALHLPQRNLVTNLDASTLCYIMDTWLPGRRCSIDIEGGLPLDMVNQKAIDNAKKDKSKHITFGWPCVSICPRPTESYTIAWGRLAESDHVRVLRSFARLMWRVDVPKVLQNQLYDNFVLGYGYRCPIRNVAEDTMIKSWEIYAELPRALDVQASIWTREPYWKDDSMYSSDGEALFRGCARDSAVTLEICETEDNVLSKQSRIHYQKMLEIQNPFLYMEHRGILYDQEKAKRKLDEVQLELIEVRNRVDATSGRPMCGPKGSLVPQRLVKVLYEEKGYPPQFKKEEDGSKRITTDIEALLNLKKRAPEDTFLDDLLLHRHLEGVRETLSILPDADGRVRCAYSLEAETGRVKCYTSPTGSGANLQTIQKGLRSNYIADSGYDFCQCDLEGADGWTVAAHAARLGDPTMLDDYLAGMKPAKIIALLYWFGSEINSLERSDLKWLHDNVFPIVKSLAGDWLYLGCKRVQHGSSYLMGIPTMCLNVLKDSFKESGVPIYLAQSEARRLQESGMFARYPGVRTWHSWAESKLVADGTLTSASGHTRIFFGRRFGPSIHDTVKEFLAHEPQNNTTWITNMAMLNLWNDPENRVGSYTGVGSADFLRRLECRGLNRETIEYFVQRTDYGALYIEPLHQVHDALCDQWPQRIRTWARWKHHEYFNNEIEIAGIRIKIPFDGRYGPSWGETKEKV